jgi:hypothetical protein
VTERAKFHTRRAERLHAGPGEAQDPAAASGPGGDEPRTGGCEKEIIRCLKRYIAREIYKTYVGQSRQPRRQRHKPNKIFHSQS